MKNEGAMSKRRGQQFKLTPNITCGLMENNLSITIDNIKAGTISQYLPSSFYRPNLSKETIRISYPRPRGLDDHTGLEINFFGHQPSGLTYSKIYQPEF